MLGYNGFEVLVEFVLFDDFVSHGYPEGLHGVGVGVVVGAYHFVEVVHHVLLEVHHEFIIISATQLINQSLVYLIWRTDT